MMTKPPNNAFLRKYPHYKMAHDCKTMIPSAHGTKIYLMFFCSTFWDRLVDLAGICYGYRTYTPSNLWKVLWRIKREGSTQLLLSQGSRIVSMCHSRFIPYFSPTCHLPPGSWLVGIPSMILGFRLGLAKGMSWQEIRGKEENEARVFMTLATPPVKSLGCYWKSRLLPGRSTVHNSLFW